MNNKMIVVLASLCVLFLATQTVSCDDEDVQRPGELYILNPESEFPTYVSNPDLLESVPLDARCVATNCNRRCRNLGFRWGRCQGGACVCSN